MKSFLTKYKTLVLPFAALLILLTVGGAVRRNRAANLALLEVRQGPIVEAVYGIGTVTARQIYNLKLAVNSTVRGLFVKEGDFVKAGAPLIYLEGAVTFKAPFAGTVTYLPYNLGETVFPQTPLLTLMDLKDRYLVVSLDQLAAFRVRRGLAARISFESIRGKAFAGQIRSIYSSNDKQFLVNIDAGQLPDEALPGMTGDVAIELSRKENAVLLPIAGLRDGSVTRVRDGARADVSVKLGIVDGEIGELLEGDVRPGDRVVVKK